MKRSNNKSGKKRFFDSLVDEMRDHKVTFTVYIILRLIVIALIVVSAVRGYWENVFTGFLTLLLLLLPAFIEKNFKVNLPTVLEIIALFFVFAAQILGEIQGYYLKYSFWDTMLHTVNGFLFAAVGFALVDILNQNEDIKLSLTPVYMALVAFCFSMTVGVLWEFFEYSADCIFKTDMQKDYIIDTISSVKFNPDNVNKAVVIDGITDVSINGTPMELGGYLDIGLHDTMKDLIVNFIGATVFSSIGYIYVKTRGKKRTIAALFIPTIKSDNSEEILRNKDASDDKTE